MRRSIAAFVMFALAGTALGAPPRPDHVVIVIEENHSFQQIIGNPAAPYMNQLAAQGALMTSMYGMTHPSQPNYLEFFSGTNQGIADNTMPAPGTPFSTPNLGAAIINAGFTFGGFSEDLPAVGSTIAQIAQYWRKHNPWVNWQALSDPPAPGSNQLPSTVNMPFDAANWPSDFNALPTLSIVVPNQDHDMHDGTIQMADDWLIANIKPYADWAVANNSLLILTWDEDESASRNRIPTIFFGPPSLVKPGQYPATWTLHHLLRTVEDMYATSHSGLSTNCRPIVGPFTTDPAFTTRTFQQGVNGYSGCQDTYLELNAPSTPHPTSVVCLVDGSPLSQSLIRFDNIFGAGANQLPAGSTILSAKLLILSGPASTDASTDRMYLHPMLWPWSDSDTWGSLVGGVSANGTEAAATADFNARPTANAWVSFDVTTTVTQWLANPSANLGWAILPSGTDGWRFLTAEYTVLADRPALEISFIPPTPPCIGDITDDHQINTADLTALLGAFGTCPGDPLYLAAANLEPSDPCINTGDLVTLLGVFGQPCP